MLPDGQLMTKTLLVVESPGKIKTIRSIVGNGFTVLASGGHVRDLPKKALGVKPDANFEEEYVLLPKKKKTITAIKAAARDAENIYLASDPDREGEAIAWHLYEILPQRDRKKVKRISFNSITADAIRGAMKQPNTIDLALVQAQRTRRVIDRLVGYLISPLLRDLGVESDSTLSAGRVQTAALRIITERQTERDNFVPRTYWTVHADLIHPDGSFTANLINPTQIQDKALLDRLMSVLHADSDWAVTDYGVETQMQKPPAPFTTSTLQQEASKLLKLKPKETQKIAQTLYEEGWVTYIRTDSVNIAAEAQAQARDIIRHYFGDTYLPQKPPVYHAKGDAQEAHEAIRPIDASLTPKQIEQDKSLPPDQLALYRLIWRRFIASQMASARFEKRTAHITVNHGQSDLPNLFRATSRQLIFPGYTKVLEEALEDTNRDKDELENDYLPQMAIGDDVTCTHVQSRERKTQPRPAFSQAGLIKEMERVGIGRPSTYANTVQLLLDRKYVKVFKGKLAPTELGSNVLTVACQHFEAFFSITYTAHMEEALDLISRGQQNRLAVLQTFWADLNPAIGRARSHISGNLSPDEICPECQSRLQRRQGKYGMFMSCTAYPACSYTRSLK